MAALLERVAMELRDQVRELNKLAPVVGALVGCVSDLRDELIRARLAHEEQTAAVRELTRAIRAQNAGQTA